MWASLDLFFTAIAITVMALGLRRRWMACRTARAEQARGHGEDLIRYLVGHKRILRRPSAGTAHLFLFWGFLTFVALIILYKCRWTVSPRVSQLLSFFTDLLAFLMAWATSYFLVRRLRSENRTLRTLLPLLMLAAIVCTGLLSEALRLSLTGLDSRWQYPIGWPLSVALPASVPLMQIMIRCHFFLVLLFVATMPFTLMRHAAAASASVYYRGGVAPGKLKRMDFDHGPFGAATILDFTWQQRLNAYACVACGRCDEVCPAYQSGKPLSPMKIMGEILKQSEEVYRRKLDRQASPGLQASISGEEVWSCTTCLACIERCPVYIDPLDKIIAIRRYIIAESGDLPRELQNTFENLEIYGDIYAQGASKRKALAAALRLPVAEEGGSRDWLLWIGCQASFNARAQDALKATVRLLKAAGLRISILGKEEACCGDMVRRAGNEYLFAELARRNIHNLQKYGIDRIMTGCPHCLNTLRNDYSECGGHFEVRHYAELLWDRIASGDLQMGSAPASTLTLQDPCYLARANSSTEQPRNILKALTGVQLREMKPTGAYANCCGGGGGRVWMHDQGGRKISDLRAEEARATGAEILITLCPHCLVMLEDAVQGRGGRDAPEVKDLGEFVAPCVVSDAKER
ncbi:MAG: (Fe-S)-binding protein [Desulfobacterales bacterium]|nr:MAG: (Fe-S)-binding protein [Desulfobacterales bacterium]